MTKAKPRVLTFEEIIAAQDIGTVTLPVPEWGGAVVLRTFSKDTELRMRAAARDPHTGVVDSERLEMLMLVHGIVEPELTDEAADHLRTKNAGVIDRILSAIVDLNRMGGASVDEATATFPEGPGAETPLPVGA